MKVLRKVKEFLWGNENGECVGDEYWGGWAIYNDDYVRRDKLKIERLEGYYYGEYLGRIERIIDTEIKER